MFDVNKIRKDFPILEREINGSPLVYLDNAATSQKPIQVIEAIDDYYRNHNANVHRGIHTLGDESTRLYWESRQAVAEFIGAGETNELVFVRNTTEAINLVAYSWGREHVKRGEVILMTEMEHHSNIVPWQRLAEEVGARVEYVRVGRKSGEIDEEDLEKKLKLEPRLVAIAHVSNFLGSINPIKEVVRKARRVGAKILVDGAQGVPHMPVDVESLGVDFYAFSGHKMLGPMGIGGLWVRRELLGKMRPFLSGGGTISEVSKKETKFADLPDKFDAGTPNVAGAVGLKAAVEYMKKIGMRNIFEHERKITRYAIDKLSNLGFVKMYGVDSLESRGGLVAFSLRLRSGQAIHAHDVAQVLDGLGIAVRSGHHCVMPMHSKLGLAATTRASFGLYNTKEEVDKLVEGLKRVKKVFRV